VVPPLHARVLRVLKKKFFFNLTSFKFSFNFDISLSLPADASFSTSSNLLRNVSSSLLRNSLFVFAVFKAFSN